uniref:BRCT domain-containing protein n=1 Tax=Oryza meridionalis TaxID=40149 RepID=A0A0E0DLZ1_9ORYZ
MAGDAGDGGGDGETQALEGGTTPPLGSPVSDDGDATPSEDGVLYGETQALDDAETQMVDDGLGEEEDGVAVDWGETQLVEGSEEEEEEEECGGGIDDQEDTQLVEDSEENEGDGEDAGGACEGEDAGAAAECDNNAGDLVRTQLVEEHKEGEDCGNDGAGDGLETQFVEECPEEEEKVNNSSDDEDAGEWGKTQLVEDSDEERDDDGDDELSVDTQVLSDDEGLSNDEREVIFDMGGSNTRVKGALEDYTKNLVDSDASTDEEGDTVCEASERKCEALTVNSLQQGKEQDSIHGAHLLRKVVDNSTSFSTSLGDHPDCGIDSDSHGYVQNHDKDGTKSRSRCSTAKKLFADTIVKESENNGRCFAGLSYIESQEPGDLSQANALELVDRLISISGMSSQEPTPQKLDSAKPHVSNKRGTLMLAEKVDCNRSSNGMAEIFAWVDSREDDGGGEFFSKNKDILLHKSADRGKSKSHFPRAKKRPTKIEPGEIGDCKKCKNTKLSGKFEALPLSDLMLSSDVKGKRASANRTKKNLLKDLDLDDLSNGKYLEVQQEKESVALHDVGPDTQIALEAMEALAQCSPAKNLSAKDKPQLRNGKSKKAKGHSKNSPQKRTGSIQEGVTTRSKRRKLTELTPEPEKQMYKGSILQGNPGDLKAKTRDKEAKSVPAKSNVLKISRDGDKCHGAPVARRTRHFCRNNPGEHTELCSNKHSKRVMNLRGGVSKVGKVQNDHIANEPGQPMISERTAKSTSIYVEKESTEHTCATDAQNLQLRRDASSQHASENTAQGYEPCRSKPTIEDACRENSSHFPKQRRTQTTIVQPKDPAATQSGTNHETPQDEPRPSKKRRVFIRSVSDYVKYAKREPSNGRSTSLLSTIIKKSSAASHILNSSLSADSKTSGFSSSGNKHKGSHVEDASKSPRSNSDIHSSVLKTPSKSANELSPIFSPLNPSKSSSRSLSKPSVARELLTLDPDSNPSNCQHKDSRRKKKKTNFSILFSHHLHGDVIKRQKKILARLGVSEALSIPDATHFVADSFFRTKKMLEAIALGKLVVTSMWLENCGQAGCFIDEKKYILRDAKKEREIGFSMPTSLAAACKHPLLLGKRVYVTLNVKPSREVVIGLVLASSGQPLERIGRSITKEVPDDLLVISCEDDYETCSPLLKRGASVFESELLLNGIVIQKLEYERHRLFSDCVKQTRSTRWLKDTSHGRFVPVSKCPQFACCCRDITSSTVASPEGSMADHPPTVFLNELEKWVSVKSRESILSVRFKPHAAEVKRTLDALEVVPALKRIERSKVVGYATCFVVAENGNSLYLLTCAHTIDHVYTATKEISVQDINRLFDTEVVCDHQENNGLGRERKFTEAIVTRVDCKKDILLVLVDKSKLLNLKGKQCRFQHPPLVASQNLPCSLEKVVMISWPPCMNRATSVGRISHPSRHYDDVSNTNEYGYNMNLIEVDMMVAEGSSGAPLLNCRANFVGLLQGGGKECFSCFVSLSDICKKLTEWGIFPREKVIQQKKSQK